MEHLELGSQPLALLRGGVREFKGLYVLLTQSLQLRTQPLDLTPRGAQLRFVILLLDYWRIYGRRRRIMSLVRMHVTQEDG